MEFPQDLERVHRFLHVVHAHDASAILNRDEGRGNAAGDALAHGPAGDLADHALAREPRHDRIARRAERRQAREVGTDGKLGGQASVKGVAVNVFGAQYAAVGAALDHFRRRVVGVVYQFHFLLPEFTALENVMMPAVVAGESRGSRTRALALLEEVGVAHRASHTPAKLSGGEQQRVAIARALMNGPRLLLADEPTGNLDEETAAQAFDLILRLKSARGLTVLMATHNVALAASCDRTVRLHEGRVG